MSETIVIIILSGAAIIGWGAFFLERRYSNKLYREVQDLWESYIRNLQKSAERIDCYLGMVTRSIAQTGGFIEVAKEYKELMGSIRRERDPVE